MIWIRRCSHRSLITLRKLARQPVLVIRTRSMTSRQSAQVPGGMVGTEVQLVQRGMSERLDDVLAETAVVRRELGYPGMATPFSQFGAQAVLNIITGKRTPQFGRSHSVCATFGVRRAG